MISDYYYLRKEFIELISGSRRPARDSFFRWFRNQPAGIHGRKNRASERWWTELWKGEPVPVNVILGLANYLSRECSENWTLDQIAQASTSPPKATRKLRQPILGFRSLLGSIEQVFELIETLNVEINRKESVEKNRKFAVAKACWKDRRRHSLLSEFQLQIEPEANSNNGEAAEWLEVRVTATNRGIKNANSMNSIERTGILMTLAVGVHSFAWTMGTRSDVRRSGLGLSIRGSDWNWIPSRIFPIPFSDVNNQVASNGKARVEVAESYSFHAIQELIKVDDLVRRMAN